MNQQQRRYAEAKAAVEVIEACMNEAEKKYIADNGIVNQDGSIPAFLWCMDDDEAFDRANADFSGRVAIVEMQNDLNDAKAALKAAEDELIAFGLSISPLSVRETLGRAVKVNFSIRQKVLDAAFRLDTKTVRRVRR